MSIAGKVAIVGVGCCVFGGTLEQERRGHDRRRGPTRPTPTPASRIRSARSTRSSRARSTRTKGPHECTDALKLYKPITMVYELLRDRHRRASAAVMAVASGVYDTVLVVGFDKPKDRGVSGPSVMMRRRARPARRRRPAGSRCAPRPTSRRFGAGREDLARIAVKNHHNGTLAPKSFLKREITVEEALGARMISWPFGLYDCAAQTDGAAAAIVTRRDLARNYRRPVR